MDQKSRVTVSLKRGFIMTRDRFWTLWRNRRRPVPQFVIVIRHREADWEEKSVSEQQRILNRYFDWTGGLTVSGVKVDSLPLRDGGRILEVVDGEIVDGPFTETKEVVGGFVLIESADWDEARAIARTCPALEVGDWVEVREASHFVDLRQVEDAPPPVE
jgi:hypothetical protein